MSTLAVRNASPRMAKDPLVTRIRGYARQTVSVTIPMANFIGSFSGTPGGDSYASGPVFTGVC